MTWSIIARDKHTGCFGIAVATRFFAAGARVPFVAAGIGAVATQALFNPFYGTNGLRLLREGKPADAVVQTLIAADTGRDHRQIHVMDARGRVAGHTEAACIAWCGHLHGDHFSIAGNMLAGADVLEGTAGAYSANHALPFARRLLVAMRADEAGGGDKRGRQSAALVIFGEEEWSDLDLRVDNHSDLLAEFDRLERVSGRRWTTFRRFIPNRRDPVGVTDRSVIDQAIARGSTGGEPS